MACSGCLRQRETFRWYLQAEACSMAQSMGLFKEHVDEKDHEQVCTAISYYIYADLLHAQVNYCIR